MKHPLSGSLPWALFFSLALPAFAEPGPTQDTCQGLASKSVEEKLAAFDANPGLFMDCHIPRSGSAEKTARPFSHESIRNGEFIRAKSAQRQFRLQGRAPISRRDRPQDLVDELKLKTLAEIEEAGLRSATLPESPWSDDYWPIYAGELAKRYADPRFPNSKDWKANADYVRDSTPSDPNLLSPAEKYDLLVGDAKQSLTRAMLEEGQYYFESTGKVEDWMGICHGWAPASFMLPRPRNQVTVPAADGTTRITFYPADIKALASLLWAKAEPETRFIGGRCDVKKPRKDPETGRVTDSECFDTNPGTWHLAVVNQIGVAKRGFVMDSTFDYEVWNQPVYSYSYTYFNPRTRRKAARLSTARVSLDQFKNDKFSKFRSPRATSVVGIAMDVTYVVETDPVQLASDSAEQDKYETVQYLYDLELDTEGRIIGGEWYSNEHPDFLFTSPEGARALSVGDPALTGLDANSSGSWAQTQPVPAAWKQAAVRASTGGQPLARIVESLIGFASGETGRK